MTVKIWWQKTILKKIPSYKIGNLTMSCLCNDHLKHEDCNDNCHGGFSDDKLLKQDNVLGFLSDLMKPTNYLCKVCNNKFSSDDLISHLRSHGLMKKTFSWESFRFIEYPVYPLNPKYIEEVK